MVSMGGWAQIRDARTTRRSCLAMCALKTHTFCLQTNDGAFVDAHVRRSRLLRCNAGELRVGDGG